MTDPKEMALRKVISDYQDKIIGLRAEVAELCETLKMTRECIAYCRKAHRDVQSGEGVPVERFIDAVLAKHQSPKEPPA